jgi:hypothetical protein
MDFLMLIFLFLVSILLTITMTTVFRNRGPWENPMLFFLVLFLTSWTVLMWTRPVETGSGIYPYITVASVALLMALLLAATRTPSWGRESMRTLDEKEVVDVITRPGGRAVRKTPGAWFWGLITTETLLILFAYYIKFF